jgi:hypothetical protein
MSEKNIFPDNVEHSNKKTQVLELLSRLRKEVESENINDDDLDALYNILSGEKINKDALFNYTLGWCIRKANIHSISPSRRN